MINIVLICGTGASSSFLAVKLREAIKKRKLIMNVDVNAESSLTSDIEGYDYILIGPHLDFLEKEILESYTLKAKPHIIPYPIYAAMDGDGLLDIILQG